MSIQSNTPDNALIYDILSQVNFSRKVSLSEEIFKTLKKAIIDGTLPSNYCFPNENEMCKMLNIGRSTLREAYSSLAILNLIKRTKNGTFVNDESQVRNIMNFDAVAGSSDVSDIIEFREIIEVGIAYNAAANATPEDIRRLEEIIEKQKENADSIEHLTAHDFEFHAELAKISRNELLYITLITVRANFEKFAYDVFSKDPQYTIQEHIDIVNAIRDNDRKNSQRLMRIHLKNLRARALGTAAEAAQTV